jgi:hypothetical protein
MRLIIIFISLALIYKYNCQSNIFGIVSFTKSDNRYYSHIYTQDNNTKVIIIDYDGSYIINKIYTNKYYFILLDYRSSVYKCNIYDNELMGINIDYSHLINNGIYKFDENLSRFLSLIITGSWFNKEIVYINILNSIPKKIYNDNWVYNIINYDGTTLNYNITNISGFNCK